MSRRRRRRPGWSLRIAAALLLLSAAARGEDSPRISVPYTQFTLPNGLDVILHEDHRDRKSTRLNSSHMVQSRMPSSA